MLEIIYIIVMMVLLFGITIFIHEFGHFLVARWCGLVIESFSIGMGPAIWEKKKNGVTYKLSAFPIGGYVALPQLDPEGMKKMQGDNATDHNPLPDISPWKKIAVAVSGPLGNVLFAILLAWIVFAFAEPEDHTLLIGSVETNSVAFAANLRPGDQIIAVNGNEVKSWYDATVESLLGQDKDGRISITVLSNGQKREIKVKAGNLEESNTLIEGIVPAIPCVLGQVFPGTPAADAGVKPGDIITEFAGHRIFDWNTFTDLVQQYPDQTVTMTVRRGDEFVHLTVTPKYSESAGRTLIGVGLGGSASMPWTLSGTPTEQIKSDASKIFRLLKALTTKGEAKKAAGGLGGPVAIFTMIWFALKLGIINALGLIRFININLAILNLLPLPVLDGGHILFALWEGVTRRKIHPAVVNALVNIFAVLLISAMILLSWRDADRNWNISRIFKVFKKTPVEQTEDAPGKE